MSTQPVTPLQLILHKYKKDMDKGRKKNITNLNGIMEVLIQKVADTEVENSCLDVAVNFPSVLECVLQRFRQFLKDLPEKIKLYFNEKFVNIGFFDLMLKHCPSIVTKMIASENCQKFLSEYKDSHGQTALHSAAKYLKPFMVKKLMDPRYAYIYYVCKYTYNIILCTVEPLSIS